MSQRQLSKDLHQLDCPSINTPTYRSCLKNVLEFQQRGKRERVMSMLEEGCDVVVSNRVVASGIGVSVVLLILFSSVLMPGSEYAPSQVQAQSVVDEMEMASQTLDDDQKAALEAQLEMELESLIKQAKSASAAMVYELDPRIPMRVIDNRTKSVKTFVVTFRQDRSGRLQMTSLVPRFTSTEASSTAYTKRRILQYASDDGQIVLIDLNENNAPRSGIVLASN